MSYRLFNVPVFALHDKSEVGGLVNVSNKFKIESL